MTSATTAIAGSSRIAAKSVVSTRCRPRRIPPCARIPDERPNDAKPVPGCTLDVVGAVLEQPVHGRADTAVARGARPGRRQSQEPQPSDEFGRMAADLSTELSKPESCCHSIKG